ncbi:MAG: alcohol dehydrogenase catalytic domain-containing protein [Actinobacteria bacterium]|nr:alcohol dehydrogenase catalytic domain-containing protein [Actinomycetota bacterium]
MKTIYMDLQIPRLVASKALGRLWSGAYTSRLGAARFANLPDSPISHPHAVRVKNLVSLICGSDLHLLFVEMDPRIAIAALPSVKRLYLGHELCGEVTEVGSEVTRVKLGDRVAFQYTLPSCATQGVVTPCPHCNLGQFHLCENQALGGGVSAVGGGWGDQLVVDEHQLFRPPPSLSNDQVALLEPAAVGLHAVLLALPEPGQKALVLGCGIIGLMTVQALHALSPEARITALARHRFQAEAAKRLGAQDVDVPRDPYEVAEEVTGSRVYRGPAGSIMLLGGFDVVFDCVGTDRSLTDALRLARARGKVVAVGIQYKRYRADLSPLYYQEVQLLGSWAYGVESWQGERLDAFELAARLVEQDKIILDGLITHRFPLAQWDKAVMAAADKRRHHSIKVAFDF